MDRTPVIWFTFHFTRRKICRSFRRVSKQPVGFYHEIADFCMYRRHLFYLATLQCFNCEETCYVYLALQACSLHSIYYSAYLLTAATDTNFCSPQENCCPSCAATFSFGVTNLYFQPVRHDKYKYSLDLKYNNNNDK